MREKVGWGVLGTAKIALEKVIPAMQRGEWSRVVAVASRDLARARAAARSLGIPRAYGSYEELLADPEVEAVYNPLPNHLHVPWSIRAADAGKHVLCEKPIGLSAAEALGLIAARDRSGVLVQEAFMIKAHPQWAAVRRLLGSGRVGQLRAVSGHFSYFNRDPANIRNVAAYGGGALMDIGCYPITVARFAYGEEPTRVVGLIERDPESGVDRLTSAMLDFPSGPAAFTCGTQHVPYQRMQFFGTRGRVEVEIPFNTPPDRPARIVVDDGSDLFGGGIAVEEVPPADHYTIQADLFSRAVREGTAAPFPLEDAVNNMRVIEAFFRSAETGAWAAP